MTTYGVKCKTHTNSINPINKKTDNGKSYILSKCTKFGSKKAMFVKKGSGIHRPIRKKKI